MTKNEMLAAIRGNGKIIMINGEEVDLLKSAEKYGVYEYAGRVWVLLESAKLVGGVGCLPFFSANCFCLGCDPAGNDFYRMTWEVLPDYLDADGKIVNIFEDFSVCCDWDSPSGVDWLF